MQCYRQMIVFYSPSGKKDDICSISFFNSEEDFKHDYVKFRDSFPKGTFYRFFVDFDTEELAQLFVKYINILTDNV